jgi:hypothetical protein
MGLRRNGIAGKVKAAPNDQRGLALRLKGVYGARCKDRRVKVSQARALCKPCPIEG